MIRGSEESNDQLEWKKRKVHLMGRTSSGPRGETERTKQEREREGEPYRAPL